MPGRGHVDEHGSDESLESLAADRLSSADAVEVQRHCFECSDCLLRLIEITVDMAVAGVLLKR